MAGASASPIDLSELGLFERGIPHAVLARLRREDPVHFSPGRDGGFWSLTRWEDVVAANRDARTFSSERRGIMMFDQTSLEGPEDPRMMIEIDPPRHTRYRRLVNRGFTPRMVATLEPRMRSIARGAIEAGLAAGRCDFATQAANRVPVAMICDLTGVPPADHDWIEKQSDRIQAGAAEGATGAGIATGAIAELCAYANRLAEAKRREPARGGEASDVVTTLLSADVDGQALSAGEFGLFFVLLAVAGNETTRSALSGGVLALAERPEAWARLRAEPALLPSAVEEILLWTSPILYMGRTALADVEVRGRRIRAGERVVLWYASANFDEAIFAEPLRFDPARAPNEHVAFGGGGPHFCLGASLARLELRVVLEELVARVGAMRVAGPVTHAGSNFSNGIFSLPLELEPARG